MIYPQVVEGVFLRRPNRFIAHVEIEGKEEVCHVKNTGRCRELLVPGCRVYLAKAQNNIQSSFKPVSSRLYSVYPYMPRTETSPERTVRSDPSAVRTTSPKDGSMSIASAVSLRPPADRSRTVFPRLTHRRRYSARYGAVSPAVSAA